MQTAFPTSISCSTWFSIRAGSRRIQVNSPPNFFGNYPSLNRVFVCFYRINVMSVFCTNPLIFAPESWKCTLRGPAFQFFSETRSCRPCKFRLCREFFPCPAPSPLVEPRGLKVFKRFLKCTSCPKGLLYFTRGSMTASMKYLYMHSVLCPF